MSQQVAKHLPRFWNNQQSRFGNGKQPAPLKAFGIAKQMQVVDGSLHTRWGTDDQVL
jgi:hypothetical protein